MRLFELSSKSRVGLQMKRQLINSENALVSWLFVITNICISPTTINLIPRKDQRNKLSLGAINYFATNGIQRLKLIA